MRYYPIGLDVKGKKCVVIGSGNVAQRKIKRLIEFGARVVIVNPYKKSVLKDAFLVFACTNKLNVNKQIAKDAKKMRIPVNVAKPGSLGNFILPAIVEKNGIMISISTQGKHPAMAKRLKELINEKIKTA